MTSACFWLVALVVPASRWDDAAERVSKRHARRQREEWGAQLDLAVRVGAAGEAT